MKYCAQCGAENLADAVFCEACGRPFEASQRPPTINVKAPRAVLEDVMLKEAYPLVPDLEMMLGRGDEDAGLAPDIRLSGQAVVSAGVSRMHAKVFCRDDVYYVVDMGSTNSTFLNGKRLVPQEESRLSDGDEVRLGRYLLTFREL
ncbi:MAG: FHA domain-containing protein [Actinobacteria bacterium]|nr:FHA domain-containing protein [Actinomycetota bacterium]MBU1944124.1 FHA domain-containing protein [Actinomycetota bacterium]MBU2686723.1 FHA domain-containing protein [Actinomycetota bacterium]